jgi:hypothetical protein
VGVSEIEIQEAYDSLDCCCFDVDSGLQNYIFILAKSSSGKLDHLLLLERTLESKLALVFACSFFIRYSVFVFLKSKYHFQESCGSDIFHLCYL